MKTGLALGLAASLVLFSAAALRAEEEKVDTSRIRVRKAIADKMTPEQLQAHKERLARMLAQRKLARAAKGGVNTDTPADTCPAATLPVTPALPFGPVLDTTVGMTNDYQPALSATLTCSAPTNCTGRPSGRGEVYYGTGFGPDRAYRIRTDANCSLTIDLSPTDPSPDADDLSLMVYQTQCSDELTDCVCASDTGFPGNPDGNDEQVILQAEAGTDYFVVIDGYSSSGAPPGEEGPFSLTVSGTGCNLVTAATKYHTVTPCRLIDTRLPAAPTGGPALVAGLNRTFPVAGSCGIPANASAVFLNVTVVTPTAAGNLRIFPTGSAVPTVSALNYSAGQTRGNNGTYSLDAIGRFDIRCAQASGTAHVVVDVAGYFLE